MSHSEAELRRTQAAASRNQSSGQRAGRGQKRSEEKRRVRRDAGQAVDSLRPRRSWARSSLTSPSPPNAQAGEGVGRGSENLPRPGLRAALDPQGPVSPTRRGC